MAARAFVRPPGRGEHRHAIGLLLCLCLPLLLGGATRTRGAVYDPALRWRTIATPHFRINYHNGL